MAEALEEVLRLVAEGRLTAEEAAPIVEALMAGRSTGGDPGHAAAGHAAPGRAAGSGRAGEGAAGPEPAHGSARGGAGTGRRLRIAVHDSGRRVVEVVVPGALASLAGSIPGIPAEYLARVRSALADGLRGPVVDVRDASGDGVTITVE